MRRVAMLLAALAVLVLYFGADSYHLQDDSLYYMNLKQNVAQRVRHFSQDKNKREDA